MRAAVRAGKQMEGGAVASTDVAGAMALGFASLVALCAGASCALESGDSSHEPIEIGHRPNPRSFSAPSRDGPKAAVVVGPSDRRRPLEAAVSRGRAGRQQPWKGRIRVLVRNVGLPVRSSGRRLAQQRMRDAQCLPSRGLVSLPRPTRREAAFRYPCTGSRHAQAPRGAAGTTGGGAAGAVAATSAAAASAFCFFHPRAETARFRHDSFCAPSIR